MKKGLNILLTVLCVLTLTCGVVFAEGGGFTGIDTNGHIQITGAEDTAKTIIGAIQWIGYAIAVGMLVFVGIKYVMASANEKADLKNSLIKYVIGAILIAGATTIASWVFAIMSGGSGANS